MGNANLTSAKRAKNDEFYTRTSDIDRNYERILDHPRGKAIYAGRKDDLREGLTLMAEDEEFHGTPTAETVRVLDECDPAAPGQTCLFL